MSKKVAVSLLSLGYTRQSGALLYNPDTLAFEETPVMESKRQLYNILGLSWEPESKTLIPDGKFNENITIRTGVGKYRFYKESNSIVNVTVALAKVHEYLNGKRYELVTSMCARMLTTEEALIRKADEMVVSGVLVENNKLIIDSDIAVEKHNYNIIDDFNALESIEPTEQIESAALEEVVNKEQAEELIPIDSNEDNLETKEQDNEESVESLSVTSEQSNNQVESESSNEEAETAEKESVEPEVEAQKGKRKSSRRK